MRDGNDLEGIGRGGGVTRRERAEAGVRITVLSANDRIRSERADAAGSFARKGVSYDTLTTCTVRNPAGHLRAVRSQLLTLTNRFDLDVLTPAPWRPHEPEIVTSNGPTSGPVGPLLLSIRSPSFTFLMAA